MYTEVLEDKVIIGALSSLACIRRVKCGKLAAWFTSAFAGMLWSGQRASNQNNKRPGVMPSKSLNTYYCICSGQCHALLLASVLASVMLCKHWKVLDEMHGKHSLEFEHGAPSAWNLKACMTVYCKCFPYTWAFIKTCSIKETYSKWESYKVVMLQELSHFKFIYLVLSINLHVSSNYTTLSIWKTQCLIHAFRYIHNALIIFKLLY